MPDVGLSGVPSSVNYESRKFLPWTRQRTGTPLIFRAYVVRASDRQIVRACSHNHTRRHGHTGQFYALRCAERMVRQMEAPDA